MFQYNSYQKEPFLVMNDNNIDQVNEVGFEKQEIQKIELFEKKDTALFNFPQSERIKLFLVSENSILIIAETNNIYRYRFNLNDKGFKCYQLPEKVEEGITQNIANIGKMLINTSKQLLQMDQSKKEKITVERVFMNTTGYHCLICSDTQDRDNYYFNIKEENIRYLPKFKYKITCAAFDETQNEFKTNYFIIGTDEGEIYLCNLEIKDGSIVETINVQNKIQLISKFPILQIFMLTILLDQQQGRNTIIIASTRNSISFFYGTEINAIMSKFTNQPERVKKAEVLQKVSQTSFMNVCYNVDEAGKQVRPHSFIWTNGKYVRYYKFPGRQEQINENFQNYLGTYNHAKKQDYESQQEMEMPIGIGLTEFHYYILYSDGLTIMSRITEKIVKYEDLKQIGTIQGMAFDKNEQCFWIYSRRSACKIDVTNEHRDVWKLYQDKNMYKEAFEICQKYKSPYKDYIGGLYADELFSKNQQYELAATLYFDVKRNAEEIFLKFLSKQKGSDDHEQVSKGLQVYLELWLQYLKPDQKVQKQIILSWLAEIKVYQLNCVQKQRSSAHHHHEEKDKGGQKLMKENEDKVHLKIKDYEEKYQKFLDDHIQDFNEDLVYQVMQSHGRLQNLVYLAQKKNSYDLIIIHYINEEQYDEAIENLKKFKDSKDLKKIQEIIYKYCYILMQKKPKKFIDFLINNVPKFSPVRLIGGLMNIPPEQRDEGIKLLKHSIKKLQCKEKSIHNIFIFFLTYPPKLDELITYLDQQQHILQEQEKVYFDLDFALKLFERNKLIDPQIKIYGMMGLYNEAVSLALTNNFEDMAKDYAKRPQNPDVKKKLWLQIAIHLLEKKGEYNIKSVTNLTKETDCIKIEDLLPYFHENIKIEHFKNEICDSLKQYSDEIDKLKREMDGYSKNAEQLKNELRMIKNRYIEVDSSKKCEECFKNLFEAEFYIFPCTHSFHKKCLYEKIQEQPLFQNRLEELKRASSIIDQLTKNAQSKRPQDSSKFINFATSLFNRQNDEDNDISLTLSKEEEKELRQQKEIYDNLLASECIYCGPGIVESIVQPFAHDEGLNKSWEI